MNKAKNADSNLRY